MQRYFQKLLILLILTYSWECSLYCQSNRDALLQTNFKNPFIKIVSIYSCSCTWHTQVWDLTKARMLILHFGKTDRNTDKCKTTFLYCTQAMLFLNSQWSGQDQFFTSIIYSHYNQRNTTDATYLRYIIPVVAVKITFWIFYPYRDVWFLQLRKPPWYRQCM